MAQVIHFGPHRGFQRQRRAASAAPTALDHRALDVQNERIFNGGTFSANFLTDQNTTP